MSGLRHSLARSRHPAAIALRQVYKAVAGFTLPAPKWIVKPLLLGLLAVRALYYFIVRVFVCEPWFKAYCTRYGRGVRTGVHLHWVQGSGRILLGDRVVVDGKCSFAFASRFTPHPTLVVGDDTYISHGCTITVGKAVTIGKNCRIAVGVVIFDSSGHPADPSRRLADHPPGDDEVRPVTIGDNVWIGIRSFIFPGVTVGDGSIVSAGSVVISDVPPNTIVMGNPARRVASLGS